MNSKHVNATVEILGKPYTIRCAEHEVALLEQAADYLHEKMSEVQASGKVINIERIAVITALNVASQFLQSDQQKSSLQTKLNNRLSQLQDKLDTALNNALQTELKGC